MHNNKCNGVGSGGDVVGGDDGAGVVSVNETDTEDAGSNNSPSTRRGSSCCSAETSSAWDIARSAAGAPDGAEDGCKKICKGFPPPVAVWGLVPHPYL